MLRKSYTKERASVLNQTKMGASLVLAAAKPELKQVALAAYGCSDCGFHFASNSGSEPFCSNCGSGNTQAKTMQTASIPKSDKDITSIHCSTCNTFNLVESRTDKVLAGVAHCVTCGSSLVYDANDGGADPATTRPPIREALPVVEHATDDEQNQDAQGGQGQQEQASDDEQQSQKPWEQQQAAEDDQQQQEASLAAGTAENDGQHMVDGAGGNADASPNQRLPDADMQSDVSVEHANEDDEQQQQQASLAAGTSENDGQHDVGVGDSSPNQRLPDADMQSGLSMEHANDRWGGEDDGLFVDPLDEQQAAQQQEQQVTQQQQAPMQSQQTANQGQQQQQMQSQQQANQQQQAPMQQQRADMPTFPAEEIDIGDDIGQEEQAIGVPALAMSLASVVLASVKPSKQELTLISHDGGVLAQVAGVQVATLTEETAGTHAGVMHSKAFHLGVKELAKTQGVRAALAHFGFKETQVKLPQTRVVASLVQKRVAEQASAMQASTAELAENFEHSLQLAATGLNKGQFKGKTNPLIKTLANVLVTAGVQNAESVVRSALLRSGDAYNETLIEVATSLVNKGTKYRNELAEMLAGTTVAPDFGEVQDGFGRESVESALQNGGLTPVREVRNTNPETASVSHASSEGASIHELRARVGGRLF